MVVQTVPLRDLVARVDLGLTVLCGAGALDRPIREVMTASPVTVPLGTRVADAVELLRLRKISELPVVDAVGRPVGLIDITDLIGLVPHDEQDKALVA